MGSEIERLLEAANSAKDGTTSVNSAKRTFVSAAESDAFFAEVRSALFDIENWKRNSSPSSYELFTAEGQQDGTRKIKDGSFIRIQIYGSGKYDWVQVMKITENADETVITVKPTFDPTEDPPQLDLISHFFHADARNNFCVQHDDRSVRFYVIGLSERQNVSQTGSVVESARNAATANLGYYLGIQKTVWTEFATNFLRTAEERAA